MKIKSKMQLLYLSLFKPQRPALFLFIMRIVYGGQIKLFSCGLLYYRSFYLDSERDILFVGAMNRLFRLNLKNINSSECFKDAKILEPADAKFCRQIRQSPEYNCQNHIRAIQPWPFKNKTTSYLYFCGTNAFKPQDYILGPEFQIMESETKYVRSGTESAVGKCPFNPDSSNTAIWVSRGNPRGLPGIYSGIDLDSMASDKAIFRTLYGEKENNRLYLRTYKNNIRWLNEPHFVGSYDMDKYVYFFFRETNCKDCDIKIYSRVARVCKEDIGGKNKLKGTWTSFLKARLKCSKPGQNPFYFHEIYDIYKHPDDDQKFYGTFTTSILNTKASAICSYNLKSIEGAFNGKFKDTSGQSVPKPRPGVCVNDSKSLPEPVLTFIENYPLMESDVSAESKKPIFYSENAEFVKLIVDFETIDNNSYSIVYVGTIEGKINKVVEFQDNVSKTKNSSLIDVFHGTYPATIRAMAISKKHRFLYVSSDNSVIQLNVALCEKRQQSCLHCVLDPHCQWNSNLKKCELYESGQRTCSDVSVVSNNPGTTDNASVYSNKPGAMDTGYTSQHYTTGNMVLMLLLFAIGNG